MGSALLSRENTMIVAGCSGASWSHTGDLVDTTLASVLLPPLNVGDLVEVFTTWTAAANNSNAKTCNIRIGTAADLTGTLIESLSLASALVVQNYAASEVRSLGPNSNVGHPSTANCFATSSGVTNNNAVVTTGTLYIEFDCQLGVNTDTITLNRYLVRVARGA